MKIYRVYYEIRNVEGRYIGWHIEGYYHNKNDAEIVRAAIKYNVGVASPRIEEIELMIG